MENGVRFELGFSPIDRWKRKMDETVEEIKMMTKEPSGGRGVPTRSSCLALSSTVAFIFFADSCCSSTERDSSVRNVEN